MCLAHYHNILCREGASSFFEDKDHGISNLAPGAEPVLHSDHVVTPVGDEPREEALPNTQTHQISYGQEAPFSVFGLVPSLSALSQPVNTESAETQACGISCHNLCIKNLSFYLFDILTTTSSYCSLEIPLLQLYHQHHILQISAQLQQHLIFLGNNTIPVSFLTVLTIHRFLCHHHTFTST